MQSIQITSCGNISAQYMRSEATISAQFLYHYYLLKLICLINIFQKMREQTILIG